MYGPSPAPIRIPSRAKTAPFSGCMSAKIGQSSAHCARTAASSVKTRGRTSESARSATAKTAADDDRERDHPDARVERTLRASCAELPADDDLTGDRDRVEHEREKDPELERDLVGAELRVAEARDDRAGEQERADERRGADEEELADREQPPRERRAPGARSARPTRRAISQTNTAPMHVCATAVPQAEPSIPQSKP